MTAYLRLGLTLALVLLAGLMILGCADMTAPHSSYMLLQSMGYTNIRIINRYPPVSCGDGTYPTEFYATSPDHKEVHAITCTPASLAPGVITGRIQNVAGW